MKIVLLGHLGKPTEVGPFGKPDRCVLLLSDAAGMQRGELTGKAQAAVRSQ